MNREFLEGVIYKIIKYSDNSAIACAYTKDYGKLKLFIPKAYTKKSGIMALVPGEIDLLKKDNSNLNKLYNFTPYNDYFYCIEDPVVSIRLNLFFDIFDSLYAEDQKEPSLWNYLTKFTHENVRKGLVFSAYSMMKNCGVMFDGVFCSKCGKESLDSGGLMNGLFYCGDCAPDGIFRISAGACLTLRALAKPALFKNLTITKGQEFEVLDLFTEHIKSTLGKGIKSYKTFKELINSL